jgi:hypothetical protein
MRSSRDGRFLIDFLNLILDLVFLFIILIIESAKSL